MDIKDYVKSVKINREIWSTLEKADYKDRLGNFVLFELVKYPNESISSNVVFEYIKLMIALLGYPYEHIKNIDFGEIAECWVLLSGDYNEIRVVHKYWSLKKCQLFSDLVITVCGANNIPVNMYG